MFWKFRIPDQKINVHGRTFEQHANTLVQNEFIPAGFELIRWTKLPYLCEGDMKEVRVNAVWRPLKI